LLSLLSLLSFRGYFRLGSVLGSMVVVMALTRNYYYYVDTSVELVYASHLHLHLHLHLHVNYGFMGKSFGNLVVEFLLALPLPGPGFIIGDMQSNKMWAMGYGLDG
jgi:hypothetical protein